MIRVFAALVLAVVVMICISLAFGDVSVALPELARILAGSDQVDPRLNLIVLDFRFPRALVGLTVGMALGVAGVIAQATMRNPLAEPGLLGISAGAGLAAVIVLVHAGGFPQIALPLASFVGAILMTCAILLLAWRDGTSSTRIILIGIGLNALASAAATFISLFGDVATVQQAMVWLAGSVQNSSWSKLAFLVAWLVPLLGLSLLTARELDALNLAGDTARSLGQRFDLMRMLAMLLCAVISGLAVSAAGLIGFIGLIAPHIARRLVGSVSLRLIPAAALLGGLLVMAADFAGRTVIAPSQIPVGLATAVLGTPFFFLLMWRQRHG